MTSPLYTSVDGYVQRILFVNGQILHHYHLNVMQEQLSFALKEKTIRERYDTMLLFSPYKFVLFDALIDDRYKDPQSTAERNEYNFTFSNGFWLSKPFYFPADALVRSFMVMAGINENQDVGATVSISYRTTSNGLFVSPNSYGVVELNNPTNFLQLKITCNTTGIAQPSVHDYAVLWK